MASLQASLRWQGFEGSTGCSSGWTLSGQLEPELSDEEFLEFVGRGISAKDKPTPVSGWEMDVEHLDGRKLFQNRSRRQSGGSEPQFVTQGCVEAKRVFFSDLTGEPLQYLIRSHL